MKKSILSKIILAMLVLALAFALVACGDNGGPTTGGDDNTGNTGDDKTSDNEEFSLGAGAAAIIKTVSPFITTVKSITADSTVGVNIGAAVQTGNKTDSKSYNVSIKGNVAKKPELSLSYSYKEGTSTEEWFNLGYKDKNIYLNQPLTVVNTNQKHEKVKADVTALEPALDSVMNFLMGKLEELAGLEALESIDFDKLGDDIEEALEDDLIKGVLGGLGLKVLRNKTTGNYTLTLASTTTEELPGLVDDAVIPIVAQPGSTAESVINTVLSVLGQPSVGTILEGFLKQGEGEDAEWAALNITVLTDSDGGLSGLELGYEYASGNYGKIVINLGLSTSKKQSISFSGYDAKALQGVLEVKAPMKGVSGKLTAKVNPNFTSNTPNLGYAELELNGKTSKAYYNGKDVFFDASNAFKAFGEFNGNAYYTKGTEKSIVTMINEAAAKIGQPAADEGSSGGSDASTLEAPATPEKPVDENAFSFSKLFDAVMDGKEKDAMAELKKGIGDYVRFTIDDTSASNNYINTLKSILALVAANDQWIIGFDVVKDDLSGLTTLMDITKFDKWVVSPIQAPTNGKFGIVNWDSTNWTGGIQLALDGEKNDLLDAANVFAKIHVEGKDFDINIKNIAGWLDHLLDKAAYKLAIDGVEDGDALLSKLVVFEVAADSDKPIIEQILDAGANLYIGCKKDQGINGYIGLKKNAAADADVYAEISANVGFVANDVNTKVSGIGFTGTPAQVDVQIADAPADATLTQKYQILNQLWNNLLVSYVNYTAPTAEAAE